jgi:hypothetical protein
MFFQEKPSLIRNQCRTGKALSINVFAGQANQRNTEMARYFFALVVVYLLNLAILLFPIFILIDISVAGWWLLVD